MIFKGAKCVKSGLQFAVLMGIALVGAGSWICAASADGSLIGEVESLRNSLPAQDPTRPALTLRLADLLFDEIGAISRGHEVTSGEQTRISQYQVRAITAYQEALSGSAGTFKPLSGNLKLKVQFQMARLYSDMGKSEQALTLWNTLVAQDQMPELKREASLRLAEISENNHDYAMGEAYYKQAIGLCNGMDLCSYAHYRRAWMMKNQGKLDDAVAEIQLALWDSKGQVREEALRDFVTFLGERSSDGKTETALIENLVAKINRPSLLSDLAASFFAAGNRVGGVYTLALVDSRNPSAKNKIRLLEEYYGTKQLDAFHGTLENIRQLAANPAVVAEVGTDVESEKILKRLTVQLDGERTSQPIFTKDFEATVELHLALYPKHEDTLKMMEGWIAAEPSDDAKSAMVRQWINQPAFQLSTAAKIELHETRAAIAQKKKDNLTASQEMLALSQLVTDPAKKREYRYVYGRSLYGMKNYDQSLPVFLELADISNGAKPDKWAVQSQNLALDIYAQRKQYDLLGAQALKWTGASSIQVSAKEDPSLQKELAEMTTISEKSQFEQASMAGDSPEALAAFLNFCTGKKFLPQSCENAKILSVHLKDETSLIVVLKALNDQPELATEYEAAGYFAEAAQILEKETTAHSMAKNGFPDKLKDGLKIALLYELGRKFSERDRVLGVLMKGMPKQTTFGDLENLLFMTLNDASLLNAQSLAYNWSPRKKAELAELLETKGMGNAGTRGILLASMESTGPKWNGLVLGELHRLSAQESKTQFYGARSQQKFAARINELKKLVGFSDKYLPGADAQTRLQMLGILQKSHAELAEAILKTPIPEVVQGEQLKQVQEALGKMAEPFQEKAKDYSDLVARNAAPDQLTLSAAAPQAAPPTESQVQFDSAINGLHRNPSDFGALSSLQNYYESAKQDRCAAYFKGRLLQQKKSL